MGIQANPHKTTGFLGWIDDRFPLTKMWKDHVSEYYAPKNFNFWYFFGSLAMLVLALATLVIAGPWMLGEVLDYMHNLFSSIPQLVG